VFGHAAVPYSSLPVESIGVRSPAGRVPDASRLGVVTLQIAQLERSLDFYLNLIGFSELEQTEEAGKRVARLGAAGSDEVMLELREKPGVHSARRSGRLGLYHFAVLLPRRADLGRFLRHVHASGASVGQSDHLYSEASYLTDPDGIEIEVYRDRPRKEWLLTPDGEIIGASEPLDLPGLAAAAGREPWTGLPEGTTIGHMHFYVGDLKLGESFYHAALGLDKVTWNFPSALFLSTGGYHHHVGLNIWAAGSPASGPDDARLLTWELRFPDPSAVEEAAGRLRSAGYRVLESGVEFLVDDPWGITLRLTSPAAITSP
jgi:catechol 2,3-dioxygenase